MNEKRLLKIIYHETCLALKTWSPATCNFAVNNGELLPPPPPLVPLSVALLRAGGGSRRLRLHVRSGHSLREGVGETRLPPPLGTDNEYRVCPVSGSRVSHTKVDEDGGDEDPDDGGKEEG